MGKKRAPLRSSFSAKGASVLIIPRSPGERTFKTLPGELALFTPLPVCGGHLVEILGTTTKLDSRLVDQLPIDLEPSFT